MRFVAVEEPLDLHRLVLQHFVILEEPLHLSIMGCAVNGPGEAHDSQLGITFGRQVGMIFKDGVPMRKVAGADIVEEFVKEVEILRKEGANAKPFAEEKKLVQIS